MRLLPVEHLLVRGKQIGDLVMLTERDTRYAYDDLIIFRIASKRQGDFLLVVEQSRLKLSPLPPLLKGSKLAAARTCTYHNDDDTCYLHDCECTKPACYRDGRCEGAVSRSQLSD